MTQPINWTFSITCNDCSCVFDVKNVAPSVDLISAANTSRGRMFLLAVPNECPECKNLRVVKGGAG